MKTMKLMLSILAISVVFLSACTGRQCLKGGGNYDEIEGSLEYCFDSADSKAAGVPIYSNQEQKMLLLPEKEIVEAAKVLEESTQIEARRAFSGQARVHPWQTILRIVRDWRKKN